MWGGVEIWQASAAGTGESPVDNTPMGTTSTTPGDSSSDGSNFWGNIGGAITGAASAFGQLFLTKELAKIQASTATTVANANAQVAAANNQAAAAASNAQAQAAASQTSATMKTVMMYGGIAVAGIAGLVVLKKVLS